jgi:DNA-3-methyladenine glycosylase
MPKLPRSFFLDDQVVAIAKALLGKTLCSCIGNAYTSGIIVETEAYNGVIDRASHAFGNRHTARTATMYQQGGRAYIYLCYGIHHLFNVVTGKTGTPHAVLIRALEPVDGIAIMLARTGKQELSRSLTGGPGALTKAMGISVAHNGIDLVKSKTIWIEDDGVSVSADEIVASARVGVAYAGNDALLPYRFRIAANPWTSPAK